MKPSTDTPQREYKTFAATFFTGADQLSLNRINEAQRKHRPRNNEATVLLLPEDGPTQPQPDCPRINGVMATHAEVIEHKKVREQYHRQFKALASA
jgi:hypothetical protein